MISQQASRSTASRLRNLVVVAASLFVLTNCGLESISGPPRQFRFEIQIDTVLVIGAPTTVVVVPEAEEQLEGVTVRFASTAPSVIAIDSLTGIATALTAGTAILSVRADAADLPPGGVERASRAGGSRAQKKTRR